jgi:hypothetical protein
MAKKMTKKDALFTVYQTIKIFESDILPKFTDEQVEKLTNALEIIESMYADLVSATSPERNAERRNKNAEKRAQEIAPVVDIVLDILAQKPNSTAIEVFEVCKDKLPLSWTDAKVQYLLLNDLKDKVGKNEVKGKPNTYYLVG